MELPEFKKSLIIDSFKPLFKSLDFKKKENDFSKEQSTYTNARNNAMLVLLPPICIPLNWRSVTKCRRRLGNAAGTLFINFESNILCCGK